MEYVVKRVQKKSRVMTPDSVFPFEGFACNGSERDVTVSVGSSHEVHLNFGAHTESRRTVLVESSLFAVCLQTQDSAMRSSDIRLVPWNCEQLQRPSPMFFSASTE
jgi:hypothetical protein